MSNAEEVVPKISKKRKAISAPSNWFERFLWFSAGADADILERCPESDRVKYQGIGGIIFATGVLAFVSSSYALWTVFSPKEGMALEETTTSGDITLPLVISIVGGLIWGAVIWNIDRFIVSSTGSGDGTSKITFSEFFYALPRMFMAALIGICLSTPLELRILKPEIDMQLHIEQEEIKKELDEKTREYYEKEDKRLSDEITKIEDHIREIKANQEVRRQEVRSQRTKLELEAEGKTGSGKAGRGPAWQDKKDNLDAQMIEFEDLKKQNEEEIDSLYKKIQEKEEEQEEKRERQNKEKEYNSQKAHQTDGLLKRIEIAHDIGGMMRVVLTLLLLSIELGPIFFKMMIAKSTYDYLKEQKKENILANQGLFFEHKTVIRKDEDFVGLGGWWDYWTKGKITEVRYLKNLYLERKKLEMKKQIDVELALTEKVHREYQKRLEEDISKNLDNYLD